MKKLCSLLVALVMIFALATTAFAAGTGTITVENATIGKDYYAFMIFDADYVDTNSDGVPDGAVYTVYPANPLYSEIVASGLFDIDGSNHVTLKSTKTIADVAAWANGLVWDNGTLAGTPPDASELNAATESFYLTGLDQGYYFVTTNNGAMVTITNADAAVTVIDKNQLPGFTDDPEDPSGETGKTVSASGDIGSYGKTSVATIGDAVYFKINAVIPAYDGMTKIQTYTFTDVFDASLDLLTDISDINVSIYEWDGTTATAHTCGAVTKTLTMNGFEVEIEVGDCTDHPLNTYVEISYSTTLNGNAVYDNMNTVTMEWEDDDPDSSDGGDGDSVTHTYTYKFNVQKYRDSATAGNELAGATFSLYPDSACTTAIEMMEVSTGVYRVAEPGEVGAVSELSTDTSGQLTIGGLEGTYYLKEITAPAGYNLLTTPVTVVVTDANDVDNDGTIDAPTAVINQSGTVLPETGGIGTTLFITFGSLALVLSGIFLVTNKRMKKEFY